MNAKEYRKYFADSKKDTDKLRDLDFIGCYQKDCNQEIIKKGFFELYHAHKPSEIGFIRQAVDNAEDGQAIYEFLQNAVDAHASEFFIFYNEEYFLVINNGKKFKEDNIESILNMGQSTKEKSSSDIGKDGIGFKLIHRLVGENNGLEGIKQYCGPILFSWDNSYLNDFLNNELTNVDKHCWLFKILYTNFPCGVDEKVKGVEYEDITPFQQDELDEMITFISDSLGKQSLKEGSLFFLKLGKGKSSLLEEGKNTLEDNVSHSCSIFQEYQKNNEVKLSKITINNAAVPIKNMASICGDDYIFMYSKSIKGSLDFFEKGKLNKKVSFFKYFPMESQKHGLNFIVHNAEFEHQTNRRELQGIDKNKELLTKIANDLIIKFEEIKNQDEERYRIILVNLYLSDLEKAGDSTFIQTNFTSPLLAYIKKNIPIAYSGFISSNTFVKIIDSKLDVKLKNYKKFFNFENADVIREAKSKLGLQEWNIIYALRNDDIEDWVKTLSKEDYPVFIYELDKNLKKENFSFILDKEIFSFDNGDFKNINEIDKSSNFFYKGFFDSQLENILASQFGFHFTVTNVSKYPKLLSFLKEKKLNSTYFTGKYSCEDVDVILSIFKNPEMEIKDFAIRQENDKYIIDAKSKHIHIENKAFKGFLETHDFSGVLDNLALIPEPFEKTVLSFLELSPFDEEIKKKLIKKQVDFHNLVNFIETTELKTEFLNKIQFVHFDTKNRYGCESYEHKILKMAIAIDYNIKDKIIIDGRKIDISLKEEKINFKYGRANNEKTRSSNVENSDFVDKVIKFIYDKLEEEVKRLFEIEKEDKENAYEFLKQQRRDNNTINTFQRLKFVVHYSLEQNKNLFIEFSDVKIISRNTHENESFSCLYSILTKKTNKPLDDIPEISVLKISTIFKTALAESYYIADSEYAIEKESLPQNFKPEYIPVFEKIGLVIDARLKDIRQRILKNESVSSDDLIDLTQEKIINTLEFLSNKNKSYTIDNSDVGYKNLKLLFKRLEQNYFSETEIFCLILLDTKTVQIKKIKPHFYIRSNQLNSENKYFKSRLLEEIQSKEIIYVDNFIDEIPPAWVLIDKNDKEKRDFENDYAEEKDVALRAQFKPKDDFSDYKAEIGLRGELLVYRELFNRYGVDNVTWNNKEGESCESFDIELNVNGETHFIEVKTTSKSPNREDLQFIMSSNQFNAATRWGRDKHLIFVVGINDAEPKLLYFNFNDDWLNSF